jgi:hypothetical protein
MPRYKLANLPSPPICYVPPPCYGTNPPLPCPDFEAPRSNESPQYKHLLEQPEVSDNLSLQHLASNTTDIDMSSSEDDQPLPLSRAKLMTSQTSPNTRSPPRPALKPSYSQAVKNSRLARDPGKSTHDLSRGPSRDPLPPDRARDPPAYQSRDSSHDSPLVT